MLKRSNFERVRLPLYLQKALPVSPARYPAFIYYLTFCRMSCNLTVNLRLGIGPQVVLILLEGAFEVSVAQQKNQKSKQIQKPTLQHLPFVFDTKSTSKAGNSRWNTNKLRPYNNICVCMCVQYRILYYTQVCASLLYSIQHTYTHSDTYIYTYTNSTHSIELVFLNFLSA